MNKKVGVLTFHEARNYGSVMQAYALQTYLKKKLNLDNELIDYIPEQQKAFYELWVPVTNVRNLVGNILKLSIAKKYQKRELAFQQFLKNKLRISERHYQDKSEKKTLSKIYDCIITGSDQIWNMECADFSWMYLLEGVTGIKKISYAASMGGGKISDSVRYRKCLEDYEGISVREQYAADLIDGMFDGDSIAEISVDPTLLLDKEDYEEITSDRRIKGDYIFLYSVYHDDQLLKTIQELRTKWNMPIVTLISRNNSYKVLFHGIHLASYEGPEDFLSYIKYAKFVLTNSFHGSVFSMIFEKEFYYIGDYKKDPRLNQLFTMAGAEEAGVMYSEIQEASNHFGKRQGKKYSEEIQNIRKKSEEYLANLLLDK